MSEHRYCARRGKPAKVFTWMREVGIENVQIVLVANCPCDSFEEQLQHERQYVDEFKPSLNTCMPYVSREERMQRHRKQCRRYYKSHRDQVLDNKRKYNVVNRDAIIVKKRKRYETQRDTVLEQKSKYYVANRAKILEKRRQYCEANREKILDAKRKQSRLYYEANREKIREQRALKKIKNQVQEDHI
jgi:hypothetical protein